MHTHNHNILKYSTSIKNIKDTCLTHFDKHEKILNLSDKSITTEKYIDRSILQPNRTLTIKCTRILTSIQKFTI